MHHGSFGPRRAAGRAPIAELNEDDLQVGRLLDRFAPLPYHPRMVNAQTLDEQDARIGIQDRGELRVQAGVSGAGSARPARVSLDREAYWHLEFVPAKMAQAPRQRATGPARRG